MQFQMHTPVVYISMAVAMQKMLLVFSKHLHFYFMKMYPASNMKSLVWNSEYINSRRTTTRDFFLASHGFWTDGFRHSDAFYNGRKMVFVINKNWPSDTASLERLKRLKNSCALNWDHDIACGGVYSVLKCIVVERESKKRDCNLHNWWQPRREEVREKQAAVFMTSAAQAMNLCSP